jgi:hypothetical protein
MASEFWLLNDGTSKILLNNGTDKLLLNSESAEQTYGWQQPPSEPRVNQVANKAARYLVAALAGAVLTPISYPGTGDALASTVTTSVRYDKTIVYQDFAETPAYVPHLAWVQPFAVPKAARRVVEFPAYAYSPYVAPAATETYAASNTTVRFRKTIIYDDVIYAPYVAPVVEDVTLDKWVGQVEQPTRRKRITEGTLTFVGDTADRFAWRQPFSLPVRAKPRLEGDYTTAPTQPQANDGIGWHRPFAQPTRRVTTRQQQELAFAGKPADPAYWFPRLSEPTRVKVRQNEGSFVYPYQTVVTGTVGDGAYLPASITTSVRYDKTIIYDEIAYAPYTPAAVVADEIAQAGTNTNVRFRKTIIYDDVTYAPYVQTVEIVTSDKWFASLSLPVRAKPRPAGVALLAPVQPQAGDAIGWYSPLSQPTRRKNFLEGRIAYNPALIEDAGIQAKWFQPFGTPRAAKRPPEFPSYFYSPYFVPPISGVGTEFNWWPNVSERIRVRSPVTQQQTAAFYPLPLPAWGWHVSFNEPTRRVTTRQKQELANVAFNEDTTTIQTKWYQPFSLPRAAERPPEYPAYFYSPYFVPPLSGPGIEYNWWPNLSERIRVRSPVTQQQFLVQGTVAPYTVTLEYAWHRPFSDPMLRTVRRQTAGAVFNPFPFVSISWHEELSLPVRRIVTRQTAGAVFNPFPQITIGWHEELSLPVRRTVRPPYTSPGLIYVAPATPGPGVGTDQPWPAWSLPTLRITDKQLRAGLMWTTAFTYGAFDPYRVVCTYQEGSLVMVLSESRNVDVDEESREVTPDERQSCQES